MMLARTISASTFDLGLKIRLDQADNQVFSKLVESLLIPCLDESSILSGSTQKPPNRGLLH